MTVRELLAVIVSPPANVPESATPAKVPDVMVASFGAATAFPGLKSPGNVKSRVEIRK